MTHFPNQRVVEFLPAYRFELRDAAALMWRHLQNVRMFVYLFDEPSSTGEEDQISLGDDVRNRNRSEDLRTNNQPPLCLSLEQGVEVSRLHDLLTAFSQHQCTIWGLLNEFGLWGSRTSQKIRVVDGRHRLERSWSTK